METIQIKFGLNQTKYSNFLKQAHFRGQRVRRRLAEALKAAQFYDDGDDEDFDYEEEVDLTAFDFDETLLEQGWTPTDTPQLPARYFFFSHLCWVAFVVAVAKRVVRLLLG